MIFFKHTIDLEATSGTDWGELLGPVTVKDDRSQCLRTEDIALPHFIYNTCSSHNVSNQVGFCKCHSC